MRNSLLSFALIAGLFLPMGVIYAQDTSTVTATCKDGTAFTGTKRSGACRGHGGVQSWGATSTATSPVVTPPPSAAATSQRSATSPGGGAGQVWVNTASKVYHCPGDRWYHYRRDVVALINAARLPAIYPEREYVDDGGLMAYGANVPDNFRRAADYVDRILKGAKPGDLPIREPVKFDFVVNLKTAKALGLTIPPLILDRADEVIE